MAPEPSRVSLFYNPKVRGIAYQTLLVLVLGFFIYEAASNVVVNLQRLRIASGFGFWNNPSGFDVNQKLIAFDATDTYGRAFFVGLYNTLLVASISIVLATLLGFLIGIARLSANWLVSQIAKVYIEFVRNIPLLLQLFFWYNAVLKPLPNPRQSVAFGGGFFLNNRGLFMPAVLFEDGAGFILLAGLGALAVSAWIYLWSRRRQLATGQQFPVLRTSLALLILCPVVAYFVAGRPLGLAAPSLQGFNFRGGLQVFPEFVALLFGLTIYTAGFIAEIVRSGIVAVPYGQGEAAKALGLTRGKALRLVIVPQAMQIIIPPLTNQYLNITKNSTLAVAIGYPDLVQIFAGTVLNQTGQAVEVIAITMAVYLAISLVTSVIMNIYNARVAIVER